MRNARAKRRLISNVYASHVHASRSAAILFSGLIFFQRIPRTDSQSRRGTREPRLRSTPPGRPTLFPLCRPFRPVGRTPPPAIETCRVPSADREFVGTAAFAAEGNRSTASAFVPAALSRGHADARTLRDGRPTIVPPMDIAMRMRKPPLPSKEGGGSIQCGLLAAA